MHCESNFHPYLLALLYGIYHNHTYIGPEVLLIEVSLFSIHCLQALVMVGYLVLVEVLQAHEVGLISHEVGLILGSNWGSILGSIWGSI